MKKNFASYLRQIITIQQAVINDDGAGGQIEKWQDLVTVRAEVKALYDKGSGEIFAAMQLMDNSFYRFRIRFISGAHSSSKCNTAMLKEYLSRCFVI